MCVSVYTMLWQTCSDVVCRPWPDTIDWCIIFLILLKLISSSSFLLDIKWDQMPYAVFHLILLLLVTVIHVHQWRPCISSRHSNSLSSLSLPCSPRLSSLIFLYLQMVWWYVQDTAKYIVDTYVSCLFCIHESPLLCLLCFLPESFIVWFSVYKRALLHNWHAKPRIRVPAHIELGRWGGMRGRFKQFVNLSIEIRLCAHT